MEAHDAFINLASYGKSRPERIIRVKARAMLMDALEAFIDLASYGKDRPVSPTLGVQVAWLPEPTAVPAPHAASRAGRGLRPQQRSAA